MNLITVVIPAYKVKKHVLNVISRIGPECKRIIVVDDACPEQSGRFVQENCDDARVHVIFNPVNLGVGGAVMAGYQAAIVEGCDVIVKIDGDGQMSPELLPYFIDPIINGSADYTKGNRFYDLTNISQMPIVRLFGNAILSILSKFSTGYWNIFDPTNGYTAIHARVVEYLPLEKISRRYFFESDMLFRLNIMRCVVLDVPMDAVYADEQSNLMIKKIVGEFLLKHFQNFIKRIFYNYFLRDLSVASFELLLGIVFMLFGVVFGLWNWANSAALGLSTNAGTVMLAAIPLFFGFQMLLAFLSFDIESVPRFSIHSRLSKKILK